MTFKETKFVRQETFENAFPVEEELLLKNGDRKKSDNNGQDATKKQMVPFSKLFRYATTTDKIFLFFGIIASITGGVSLPFIFVVFGQMTDDFVSIGKYANCFNIDNDTYQTDDQGICERNMIDLYVKPDGSSVCLDTSRCQDMFSKSKWELIQELKRYNTDDLLNQMKPTTIWYIYLGIITWVSGWIQTTFLMYQANRQIKCIRMSFYRSILRQDMGFHDMNSSGELNNRLTEDINLIAAGIGDKIGIAIKANCGFIGGLVVAFYYGWKLALVILSIVPIMAMAGFGIYKVTSKYSQMELDAYATAGAIAEEVLSSIKTVISFNGQEEELERYNEQLKKSKSVGIKKSTATGVSIGILFCLIFFLYAFTFWYGAKLVLAEDYTIGRVMILLFSLMIGSMQLSVVGQTMEGFGSARTAAHGVFKIIDTEPLIDSLSKEGKTPNSIKGKISFSNVNFTYPARLGQRVLKNISFEAGVGKTVALCGQSGCGKSTLIQLLQRFYDPSDGSIEIDGYNIKDINISYLRRLIGVVSQEPVLFDTTIRENIRYGHEEVSDKEIEEACHAANADFVFSLPEKLETEVGEGGATLSGGQKQRIAIARALVRNPKILLLDEATSALDTESESIVQKSLENAQKGRTTLIIAHRLSTIRNADVIIGLRNGEVVEQGNHDSLMKIENGVYYSLCNMQTFGDGEEPATEITKMSDTLERKKSVEEQRRKSAEATEQQLEAVSWLDIMKLNLPEWGYMSLGSLASAILGALQPSFAIIVAEILSDYSKYACGIIGNPNPKNPDVMSKSECAETLMSNLVTWSVVLVGIGVVHLLGYIIACWSFGKSGEIMTMRLRSETFRKYLNLEMSYFDEPENSTGALTTRLATDASKVKGATGTKVSITLQNVTALLAAFIIGFIYEWRLTLLNLGLVPVLILAGFCQIMLFTGKLADSERKAFEEAGKNSSQATSNIRTLASLNQEQLFLNNFESMINIPLASSQRKSVLYGFAYGMGHSIGFFINFISFHFGVWLIQSKRLPPERFNDIYRVLLAVVFAASQAGQSSGFAPDFGEAKISAAKIINFFRRKTKISDGKLSPDIKGYVDFKNVIFRYPTRIDVQVLKKLTVACENGKTLALVGQSGCGKSTLIQLVERFYDCDDGTVEIDNVPVKDFKLKHLRSQIGFVQQEPVLFDKTIRENIVYGLSKSDPRRLNIQAALEESNSADFVRNLPSGLETRCGRKGSHLSGGQKQRIALARTLIRKPKILLLDEATSALDTESEKIVQNALDKARKGRTCILIAHRLSTVVSADLIAVIDNGVVIEYGSHAELVAKQGAYYSLIQSQL